MKDFHQLFVQELREIYAAELQSVKLMPEIIHAAKSSKLKEALKLHLEETQHQVKRLEDISHELKESFIGSTCDVMQGLWNEWKHIMQAHYADDVQDAAIINYMQKIKHYEMAVYGTLRTYAKHLKFNKIEAWIKESIHEEGKADKKMTELAEGSLQSGGINMKACKRSCA